MSKLSRAELQRRMDAISVEDVGVGEDIVVAYLESGAVGSTLIGRYYAMNDPKQRREFAEWFTGLHAEIVKFQTVRDAVGDAVEGEDDDDE